MSQLTDGVSHNSMSVGGEPTKSASKGKNKSIFGMFRRKSKDEKAKKDDTRTESVTQVSPSVSIIKESLSDEDQVEQNADLLGASSVKGKNPTIPQTEEEKISSTEMSEKKSKSSSRSNNKIRNGIKKLF